MTSRSLILVCTLASLLSWTRAGSPPPNIIVYLADDMGMGDTSAYQDWSGNADAVQVHTPNMERLAKRGIRFTDAHSPSSRCSPTRYALLTGRYCWRTHLKQWVLFGVQCPPLIERERTTLPEFLQSHGYRTGMVGKWHLGLTYSNAEGKPSEGWDDADLTKPVLDGPMDHGFEFFHGISRSHPTSGPDGKKRNTAKQSIGPGWMHGSSIAGATGDGKKLDGSFQLRGIAPVLHRQAKTFLNEKSEKPFFLYFASHANHSPYTPCKAISGRHVAGASAFKNGEATGSERLDFVHENDVQLGLLMDWLDTTDDPRAPGKKLADNTLVVFTSDNGAESKAKTATGPLRSNKGSTYEGGHRVPFIAAWPAGGVPAGRSSKQLLGLNDIFATIADILDKPLPDQLCAEDSFSALPELIAQKTKPRPPLFPNDHSEARPKGSKLPADHRAWVAVRSNDTPIPGQWKLFLDHHFAFGGDLNPKELYELGSDPLEENNRLSDPAARAVTDYLTTKAAEAAGDEGRTRLLN